MEIANEFNNFCSKVGEKISKSIHKVNIKPEKFLSEKKNVPPFDFDKVGPILICDILKSMDPKKSKDMDGISLDLLKSIDTSVCKPLAHIFNLSLKTGVFPDKLKVSRVVPIFKAGDKNYATITVLFPWLALLQKF